MLRTRHKSPDKKRWRILFQEGLATFLPKLSIVSPIFLVLRQVFQNICRYHFIDYHYITIAITNTTTLTVLNASLTISRATATEKFCNWRQSSLFLQVEIWASLDRVSSQIKYVCRRVGRCLDTILRRLYTTCFSEIMYGPSSDSFEVTPNTMGKSMVFE